MTRPPLATLRPYLPPPADLSRLSDVELSRFLWAMGWRYSDGCADHVPRLLLEAAERFGKPRRYGNRKFNKMYADLGALRQAIRAHDPEAVESAWDACEGWIDLVFTAEKANG